MDSRVRFPDAEPSVHRIMVIITAFQAEDLGSIPSGRSIIKLIKVGLIMVMETNKEKIMACKPKKGGKKKK